MFFVQKNKQIFFVIGLFRLVTGNQLYQIYVFQTVREDVLKPNKTNHKAKPRFKQFHFNRKTDLVCLATINRRQVFLVWWSRTECCFKQVLLVTNPKNLVCNFSNLVFEDLAYDWLFCLQGLKQRLQTCVFNSNIQCNFAVRIGHRETAICKKASLQNQK